MEPITRLENLPYDQRLEAAKVILQNHYRSSLLATAQDLLGYKDINPRTHGEIIESLESQTKRKLIVCPRGTFKSSLCIVSYAIWILLKDPNARILIDSEVYNNSKNFVREIKSHFESPRITTIFGDFKSDNNWAEGSITIKQRTKTLKESSIAASGISATKVGQHFDYVLMDDMNSDKNSNTEEGRQKIIDHYRMNISILEPDGTIVVTATRYASNDLVGFILETELGIEPDGSQL